MANLTPTPGWDDVWMWDNASPLLGGAATDPLNRQAQALLNRIEKLRNFDATENYVAGTLGDYVIGDPVDPHAYPWLVKGDGTTDDYPALQAAITYAGTSGRRAVRLRGGKNYRMASGTPTLAHHGLQLVGPSSQSCTITIDQTTGPGIAVAASYCRLQGFTVVASTSRANYTTGTTHELAVGLFGVRFYEAAGFLTATNVVDVQSVSHPNNGFYFGGGGTDSKFVQCAAYSNRGHGFFFDDRTLLGGTSLRCGQITIDSCRAVDNGGNALYNYSATGPCYRFLVLNFETIWNAWNTSIPSLANAEMHIGGENTIVMMSAQDPGPSANTRTTTDQGRPRLAVPLPGAGIQIGSNANSITLIENRFIRCRNGVVAASSTGLELRVNGAYFTQWENAGVPTNTETGFLFGTNAANIDINVQAGLPVQFMVIKPGARCGTCRIGEIEYGIEGNSTGGLFRRTPGYVAHTITTNNVNAQARNITVNPGVGETLAAISFAGSANSLPPGETVTLFNISANNLTVAHGTGTNLIRTKTGASVTVPSGGRFTVVADPNGQPYEV